MAVGWIGRCCALGCGVWEFLVGRAGGWVPCCCGTGLGGTVGWGGLGWGLTLRELTRWTLWAIGRASV